MSWREEIRCWGGEGEGKCGDRGGEGEEENNVEGEVENKVERGGGMMNQEGITECEGTITITCRSSRYESTHTCCYTHTHIHCMYMCMYTCISKVVIPMQL